MNIELYNRASGGYEAQIENSDGDSLTIIERRSGSHAAACRAAAKSLRAAADKFDKLATQGRTTGTVVVIPATPS